MKNRLLGISGIQYTTALRQFRGLTIIAFLILLSFDANQFNNTIITIEAKNNLVPKNYLSEIKAGDNLGNGNKGRELYYNVLPPRIRTIHVYISKLIIIGLIIALSRKLYVIRIRRLKMRRLQKLRQQATAASFTLQQRKLAEQNKELIKQLIDLNRQRETLEAVKEELVTIAAEYPQIPKVASLAKSIKRKAVEEEDWKKFEVYFDQVHNNFFSKFKQRYPQITSNDLRLCAYIRMNLSSKEIAAILNLSPRGIETSRYRLRKKLNLTHEQHLNDFILSFK